MAGNDQIILDQVLEQQRVQIAPFLSSFDFFETFVVEQVLKDYDLSDEEIESGLSGAGGDGGVDGCYIFANGDLLREDFDAAALRKNVLIDVFIFQAKTSSTYTEEALNKFYATSKDIFDFARPIKDLATVYNERICNSATIFRKVYTELASKFPRLRFFYTYASRGDVGQVHPNVLRKTKDIKDLIQSLFSVAEFSLEFLGAADLLRLARRQPLQSHSLDVTEIISARGGYIALVKLKEFDRFLRDENARLRKNLFEANVRDYQGSTQVNDEIQNTLTNKSDDDFWWLNNGVTIIAVNAAQSGKTLTIEDPQIVNGLQTSTEIYKHFLDAGGDADSRSVMVRVIIPERPETSDRIIKATNSQTTIPVASLRATDKIHRDIEEYLQSFGLFYDRRKNKYKNEGRSADQIVSIPMMAQAVMSVVMQRPADARARPSSLLKKATDYDAIFSASNPINMYLLCSNLAKSAQRYLRKRDDLLAKDRNNVLFFIVMYASALLTKKAAPSAEDVAKLAPTSDFFAVLDEAAEIVLHHYYRLGATDKIAKGPVLLAQLRTQLRAAFPQDKRARV